MILNLKLHEGQKDGEEMLSFEAVDYLMETYAKDDVMAERNKDMMHFTQL